MFRIRDVYKRRRLGLVGKGCKKFCRTGVVKGEAELNLTSAVLPKFSIGAGGKKIVCFPFFSHDNIGKTPGPIFSYYSQSFRRSKARDDRWF